MWRIGATCDFTSLLNDILTACKIISNRINHGTLAVVLGSAGTENVPGETQEKLNIVSGRVLLRRYERAGHLAALASEEMEEVYPVPGQYPRDKYPFVFDPLDGSCGTGHQRILDLRPEDLHRHAPVTLNFKREVDRLSRDGRCAKRSLGAAAIAPYTPLRIRGASLLTAWVSGRLRM